MNPNPTSFICISSSCFKKKFFYSKNKIKSQCFFVLFLTLYVFGSFLLVFRRTAREDLNDAMDEIFRTD